MIPNPPTNNHSTTHPLSDPAVSGHNMWGRIGPYHNIWGRKIAPV